MSYGGWPSESMFESLPLTVSLIPGPPSFGTCSSAGAIPCNFTDQSPPPPPLSLSPKCQCPSVPMTKSACYGGGRCFRFRRCASPPATSAASPFAASPALVRPPSFSSMPKCALCRIGCSAEHLSSFFAVVPSLLWLLPLQ